MWGLIMLAYLEGTRAFVPGQEQASVTVSKCLVLMVGSGVASIVQLPVIGWFTQIAAVAVVLKGLFDMAPETATACAATLLAVTFLGIIPIGLIWAQFEHVSLRKVAQESGHANEELTGEQPAEAADWN